MFCLLSATDKLVDEFEYRLVPVQYGELDGFYAHHCKVEKLLNLQPQFTYL